MIEEKLDKILKNQEIIVRMLTDLLESVPDPSARPDIREAIKPLLASPIIKNNPVIANTLEQFMENMGGRK